jgi:hypothetical protein
MIGPTDLLHPSPAAYFKNFPGVSDLLHKASKLNVRYVKKKEFSIYIQGVS